MMNVSRQSTVAAALTIAAAAAAALLGATSRAAAEVTRIEITARTDVLEGKPFGNVGPYEELVGRVYFSLDPKNPRNLPIVDLDKAPRDEAGRVTFWADLQVMAPKDRARGNGVALFDVLNRGRKNILRDFNRAPPVFDPSAPVDLGDGFLMQRGYTLVWVGWQFDIPHRAGALGLEAPPALDNGQPITGRIATTFTPKTADPTYSLADMGRYADATKYPPVDPASPANTLVVRDGFLGPPTTIPRDQWQFARIKDGEVVPDISALYLKGGFQPGHFYELGYEATGAVVAGTGLAALRDLASAVKHRSDLPVAARFAYAYGPSQDGRLLREFLYEGFNADEGGQHVFDGVMANIAGAARGGDFNARFARPNGLGFFVASLFPYLDLDEADPISGRTDGIEEKLAPEQRPKIFYTNSSGEYWGGGRAAALTHTTLDGRADVKELDNVRIYLFAGTQHVPGGYLPSQGAGAQKPNGNQYNFAQRALLVALDRWVRDNVEPPPSAHPSLADNTLVPRERIAFPTIPGVHSPLGIPAGYRADLPDPQAHPLPLLVPQVDADGNELSGIRLPNIAVPVATYTGWNFRSAAIGEPDELLPLTGSFIPFPATKAAREQAHDPRVSIKERYGSAERYQAMVADAAAKLVRERYLLEQDVPTVVGQALAAWDVTTRAPASAGK
jgi:Alpha/beta hydrolase domain